MKTSIFEFTHYKQYLLERIASRPHKGRGERSRIATALRCQLAYVSQVLNGPAHLSPEQAEAINELLDHTDDEAEFFLLLVQLDRAGTQGLQRRIKKKIQKVLNQRLVLRNRLDFDNTLSREDQAIYYSAWYYAAIHIALAAPSLRTREALARVFQIPPSKVAQVLEFLVTKGLAQDKGNHFVIGDTRLHLEDDSPMISKHHINWRMQAIQSLEGECASELHYSSVITLSEKDIPLIRETLIKAIEAVRRIVKTSEDEALCCYTLDLFKLTS